MGKVCLGATAVLLGVAIATGCSTAPEGEVVQEQPVTEPERVPNPPPRYAHAGEAVSAEPGEVDPDAGMTIRCGGRTPFQCSREDGTTFCSSRPCIPDCTRIGCVGGEVCKKCDAGTYRCVEPGSGC